MPDLTTHASAAVREALHARGLRQQDLAVVLDLSQQAVSDRLRGRTPFTLADLDRIAAYLGVPMAELLEAPASVVDDAPEANRARRSEASEGRPQPVELHAVPEVVAGAGVATPAVLVPGVPAVGADALELRGTGVDVRGDRSRVRSRDPRGHLPHHSAETSDELSVVDDEAADR
ncbi:MAG: helix-turn-helix transcriptional regulator [Cellulomonas sp.]|nr:helix-turn-helix transcriptional regulator [Cellulomonas sp.]